MDKNGTIKRLNLLEGEIAGLRNFLNLLVVADRALGGQITRQTKETVRHSKKQRYVMEKMVEAGANYEERMNRVERQISGIFNTIHRIEDLMATKQDRHVSGDF